VIRQARSEATRRRIITAAVEMFSEFGYPATNLGDIIERAEMTKGALYYHFDAKESLAVAIMEEAGENLLATFRSITESPSPAMENIIHGLFVVADHLAADELARVGSQLLRIFAGHNAAAQQTYTDWLTEVSERVGQAADEGDLRAGLAPEAVAATVVGLLLGAEVLADAASRGDLRARVTQLWEVLLPAVASEESLPYFREYLAREALRPPPQP
jgi:AcrR family transcriptional regulator